MYATLHSRLAEPLGNASHRCDEAAGIPAQIVSSRLKREESSRDAQFPDKGSLTHGYQHPKRGDLIYSYLHLVQACISGYTPCHGNHTTMQILQHVDFYRITPQKRYFLNSLSTAACQVAIFPNSLPLFFKPGSSNKRFRLWFASRTQSNLIRYAGACEPEQLSAAQYNVL